MKNLIEKLLKKEKIEYFGFLSLKDCRIINQGLFERKTPFAKSIISMLIPYYVGECPNSNISLYAMSKDYHIYIDELGKRLTAELQKVFPDESFVCMGDHSPIAEVEAACKCGLGVAGDNNCLINDKYGSYVFIAEIFTNIELECKPNEIKECLHCGICTQKCVSKDRCLSDITQQKSELDIDHIKLMRENNTAWGCDICQKACPLNKEIEITPIDFFKKDRIERLDLEILDKMSDQELSKRAFGWRKRKIIERNIKILKE